MPKILNIISNSKIDKLDSELLLAFLLKKDRSFVISNINKEISTKLYQKYLVLENKRLDNYPIAYLCGFKYFYNYKFFVNKDVLVPRPETESLIDISLDILNKRNNSQTIIDIGTGSGAIIISLAKELIKQNNSLYKKSLFFGLEISSKALKIASSNLKSNSLSKKINLHKSNLLNYFSKNKYTEINNDKDITILANLPYLKPSELKEKSIKHEPKLALIAGKNGLIYYEKLFKEINKNIKSNNRKIDIFCEINPAQKKEIKLLADKHLKEYKTIFHKDLSNKTRFSQTKNY